MKIDAALTDLLRRERITKKELAQRLGVTPGYVSQLCKGQRGVSEEALSRIAAVLDMDVRVIVTFKPKKHAGGQN